MSCGEHFQLQPAELKSADRKSINSQLSFLLLNILALPKFFISIYNTVSSNSFNTSGETVAGFIVSSYKYTKIFF